jgi:hypothetical protein
MCDSDLNEDRQYYFAALKILSNIENLIHYPSRAQIEKVISEMEKLVALLKE